MSSLRTHQQMREDAESFLAHRHACPICKQRGPETADLLAPDVLALLAELDAHAASAGVAADDHEDET